MSRECRERLLFVLDEILDHVQHIFLLRIQRWWTRKRVFRSSCSSRSGIGAVEMVSWRRRSLHAAVISSVRYGSHRC